MAAGLVVLVGLDRSGSPSSGDLPPTSRDDVVLSVEADRAHGGVELSFTVAVADDSDATLRLIDWSPGGGADLLAAAHGDRPDTGPVVLHLGLGSIVGGGHVDYMEPPVPEERRVEPGEAIEGRATFDPVTALALPEHRPIRAADLERADGIRVCLWDATADPDGGGDPVACADDDL
ncbi:MAG TPA: hypothetical protein VF228_19190 [Iamia sp.]